VPLSARALLTWTRSRPGSHAALHRSAERARGNRRRFHCRAGPPNGRTALYGRWHAAQSRFVSEGQPPWFQQLNGHPCHRVVAALGTKVVQDQQEALIASAWEQYPGLDRINDDLRHAQTAARLRPRYERNVPAPASPSPAPARIAILDQVSTGTQTVRAAIDNSPIAAGALDPALRRLTAASAPRPPADARRPGHRAGPRGPFSRR